MPAPDHPPRVLFLSRRYPPSLGGAQTHAYKLYTYLSERMPVTLVALRRQSLVHLAWFLPWAWLRAAVALILRRVDIVYFADGVTAAVAVGLGPVRGPAHLVGTIFGLEMTFGNRWARDLMRAGAQRCAAITVISENSMRIAAEWGLCLDRMRLIYVGVEPPRLEAVRLDEVRRAFEAEHGLTFGRDRVALNIGRQVARKGVADFVERGMPLLDPAIRLVIVGSGPEADRLAAARQRLETPDRVLLLGPRDDDTCAMLRHCCDLFLMPNTPRDDDVEGYGIAPLEAMYSSTPVVAFAVDALVEAVREGGWLVPSGDYDAFADRVHDFYALSPEQRVAAGSAARDYCLREYGWDHSASRYAELFCELTAAEGAPR